MAPRDVRKFKETKKQFDKVREDMELSLVRNAQAPRHRPHEVEEATGALTLTRKCFRHLALDYVLQVSCWAQSGWGLEWGGSCSCVPTDTQTDLALGKPELPDLGKGQGGGVPRQGCSGDKPEASGHRGGAEALKILLRGSWWAWEQV